MSRTALCSIAALLSMIAFNTNLRCQGNQESVPKGSLEIEGLKPEYSTCERVEVVVRNASKSNKYVVVYAEKRTRDSWIDDTTYALNDPESLYSKIVRASLVKPGKTALFSFDRCLRPRFVNTGDQAFRSRIAEEDRQAEEAGGGTSQRIRVEIHDKGQSRVSQTVWSRPFVRRFDKTLLNGATNR